MDNEQKKIFSKNLNYYIAQSGLQQIEVAKAIGEKPTTLNMWCKGNSMPTMGKIQKLADYFRIGKSDLTDDKSKLSATEQYTSVSMKIGLQDERFQKIVVEYYNMSNTQKDLFCNFFETFISNNKSGN